MFNLNIFLQDCAFLCTFTAPHRQTPEIETPNFLPTKNLDSTLKSLYPDNMNQYNLSLIVDFPDHIKTVLPKIPLSEMDSLLFHKVCNY